MLKAVLPHKLLGKSLPYLVAWRASRQQKAPFAGPTQHPADRPTTDQLARQQLPALMDLLQPAQQNPPYRKACNCRYSAGRTACTLWPACNSRSHYFWPGQPAAHCMCTCCITANKQQHPASSARRRRHEAPVTQPSKSRSNPHRATNQLLWQSISSNISPSGSTECQAMHQPLGSM
jgi:hypothetical protein